MVKVILAKNQWAGIKFCLAHDLKPPDLVIVRSVKTLEGLRFRYEDVVRVPGWSKNPDIEAIEEIILRTHISMGHNRGFTICNHEGDWNPPTTVGGTASRVCIHCGLFETQNSDGTTVVHSIYLSKSKTVGTNITDV